MHLLIADRDDDARREVEKLARALGTVTRISLCTDGSQALIQLQEEAPDIALLADDLPGVRGLDILRQLGTVNAPATIIMASSTDVASRAFDLGAVDFFVRPATHERINHALHRALLAAINARHNAASRDEWASTRSMLKRVDRRLPIHRSGTVFLLATREIYWIEAADDHVQCHTKNEVHRTRGSLHSVAKSLCDDTFLRVHRSLLVNESHVVQVEQWFNGSYVLIFRNGKRVISSRSYHHSVSSALLSR